MSSGSRFANSRNSQLCGRVPLLAYQTTKRGRGPVVTGRYLRPRESASPHDDRMMSMSYGRQSRRAC
jgi:hypothetical protein